jgi:hypothetical protein
LDLTGGDLFLHDGNVRWRRRAVSDGNPRSPARSPSCRDCAFLPVVRFRCLCRDRCRLSVTPSARRCVFDWWRVARHERSCGGDSAVDGWASGRGGGRVIPDLPTATLPSDRSPKKTRRPFPKRSCRQRLVGAKHPFTSWTCLARQSACGATFRAVSALHGFEALMCVNGPPFPGTRVPVGAAVSRT